MTRIRIRFFFVLEIDSIFLVNHDIKNAVFQQSALLLSVYKHEPIRMFIIPLKNVRSMKFRTGLDRYNKYSAKFDPATIQARLTQVREIALQRAQEAQIKYATIDELVRPILDNQGIAGPMRAVYLGYAKKLTRHLERVTGPAATKFAEGLKAYYTTTFGADPDVIDAVTAVVAGAVVGGGAGGGTGGGP
jgi:hypothetical protein